MITAWSATHGWLLWDGDHHRRSGAGQSPIALFKFPGLSLAVQSGQTVLLGGLIQQNESKSRSGVPWLSRIPLLGRLFGSTQHQNNRTELLILITPRTITSSAEARAVTIDYEHEFKSLAPLRKKADKSVRQPGKVAH